MRRLPSNTPLAGAAAISFAFLAAMATGCSTSTAAPAAPTSQSQVLLPGVESAEPADANSPLGIDWIFTSVSGFAGNPATLIPLPGFILQPEARMLSGNTSCNPMKAGYNLNVETGTLRLTNLVNGNGLCQRANSDAEDAIVSALLSVDGFRIVGGNLELLSKGSVVATLKPK